MVEGEPAVETSGDDDFCGVCSEQDGIMEDDAEQSKAQEPKSLTEVTAPSAAEEAKHRLTHSEERKYHCSICSKAFKRQDHLNGHLLTHRSTKPFACSAEGCGKSYCDARSLRRHRENHHSGLLPQGAAGGFPGLAAASVVGPLKKGPKPAVKHKKVSPRNNKVHFLSPISNYSITFLADNYLQL